jgi:hypothetical protein
LSSCKGGENYEKEPDCSFCAQAATWMGLTDCIGRAASPTGLLIFPGSDFQNSYSPPRLAGELNKAAAGLNPAAHAKPAKKREPSALPGSRKGKGSELVARVVVA